MMMMKEEEEEEKKEDKDNIPNCGRHVEPGSIPMDCTFPPAIVHLVNVFVC